MTQSDLTALFEKLNVTEKLQLQIRGLTGRGLTLPGTRLEIATMQAIREIVLGSDSIAASQALFFAQQGLLAFAVHQTPGANFEQKLRHESNRALFSEYSIILSSLMRRDMLLGKDMR